MGSLGTGFLQGVSDLVQKKVDQNHAEQEQRNTELRNGLWKIAYDPSQPEAVRTNAQEQLQKLYPTQKKPLQKFGDLFHGIAQRLGGAQQDQSQATPQPGGGGSPAQLATPQTPVPQSGAPASPATTGAASSAAPITAAIGAATPSSPLQLASPKTPLPKAQPFQLPPSPTDADIIKSNLGKQQAVYDFWLERGKQVLGPDANPRDLAEYAGSQGQKLPPQQKRVADRGVARPGVDPATNQPYTGLWDHVVETDGTESWARRDDKKVNQQKEWVYYPGEPDDALHEVWADPRNPGKRVDENGRPVPEGATSVNPSVASAKIRGMFWGRFGQEYQSALAQGHSEDDAKRIAGQKTDAYLDKQFGLMGATRIHEVLGIDAEGNQVAVPLQSSVAPSSGPPPSSTTTAPPAPPSTSSPVPPAVPPQPAATTVPKVSPVAPSAPNSIASPSRGPGSLSTRQLGAVSPAQARQAAQFAIPITESVVQMFGDPAQPGLKPLADFASLADDPKAAARLGKAINLTLSGLGDGIGTASIGAGAGPIHVSAGGFGDWIQNELNVPGAVAGQRADIIRKALADLTPQEREAYDATMSELSVMAGLRSLNKASSAQGSIRLIENEIPKIGVNVANSKQFYDQLQKIAGAISNAMNTPGAVPKVKDVPYGVTPEMFNRIKGLSAEMQRRKDAASVSPRGKASLKSPGSAPKNADQYLQSIGIGTGAK